MGRAAASPQDFSLDVRYYRLSEELQPYFTALYSFDFKCREGVEVQDYLHPEWAAMRFFSNGPAPEAAIVPAAREPRWPFVVSGPTSKAIDFSVKTCRVIGLGLQPAGWARYCPVPASHVTDKIVDGSRDKAFAAFAPIMDLVEGAGDDMDEAARRINRFLIEDMKPQRVANADRIQQCHDAIKDPDLADVEALSERLDLNRRTLERLCMRHFGFSPKLLLRRQRFLRSLATFMLEARNSWSHALDSQYFDQAHFVRDFRRFMSITPSEYAERPHPIIDRIMAQRMADMGATQQTDLPTVLRYQKD